MPDCQHAGQVSVRIQMIHAPPLETPQKAVQAGFHAMDVDVMAEPRLGADARNAWLIRIDLPRVEIETAASWST